MNLILFGFKGCGKTYFGRTLAEKMERPFVDTDDLLLQLYLQEKGELLTVRQIHQQVGEELFRALEKKALEQLFNLTHSIIALGGGAVLNPENVEALQKIGQMVYLKAGKETLRHKMLLKRPSFLKTEDCFEEMYRTRLPIYESILAKCVDVELLNEPAVLAALQDLLILSPVE